MPALGEEIMALASGGSADHMINLYSTQESGTVSFMFWRYQSQMVRNRSETVTLIVWCWSKCS